MKSPAAPRLASSHSTYLRTHMSRRAGVTVLEILIAVALALVIILSMVKMFADTGTQISKARSTLEMSGQLRKTAYQLHRDLRGITVPVRPWPSPSEGLGYFEYVEGPAHDNTYTGADNSIGDIDDVLMFTARSDGEPFVGRVQGALVGSANPFETIESNVAEIVWWTNYQDQNGNGTYDAGEPTTLHRRVLLIRPDLDLTLSPATTLPDFYAVNDVSTRLEAGALQPNTLGDLTRREFRFSRFANFPFAIDRTQLAAYVLGATAASQDHLGEDVALSNLVAFDVRVFDPTAPIRNDAGVNADVALIPRDPGYAAAATQIGQGTFVDLNYAASALSTFSGAPVAKSGLSAFPTYCTWSWHYENDGVDQDMVFGADQGTNGLDDDGNHGVDDSGERETAAPYPVPLRGLKVTMRVLELDTQQVRQRSVKSSFVPE